MQARVLWIALLLVGALLLAGGNAQAAPARDLSGAPAQQPAQQPGPTDRAELERFLDELLETEMEEHHIAGAAVAVVKDGERLLAKGYGYADLEKDIPVDPEQTLFRIGSVTKLFTWTAVMQLAEQGKLDLDADINTYLDFHIPDTYPQPITLKHLLTHTPGFEDRFFEVLASDADDMLPVREWLVSHMPARVRPPGELAAYSNYGTALAGYIVARVAGQPYEQYIQEHILEPIGMAHTTAQQPLPPGLHAQVSAGYTYVDGGLQTFPDYLGQPALVPGGSISSSAADMARFMIAHLENGRYRDATIAEARILETTTAQQMHSTLYTHDPRLLGATYGFFDFSDNGRRTIGHSGETHPFNTLLLLLPDQNVGVFVSYNSEGGADLINQHLGFQRAFFDHYYPAPAVEPIQPPADFATRAGRFAGSYRITRGSYTTLEKVANLLNPAVKIEDPGDGTLLLATPWGEWRFVEVEPLYFRQVEGSFSIAFREDERGRIAYLFTDLTPMFAFEKLNWYETPGFHLAWVLGCALIFLFVILVVAFRLIWKRRPNGVFDGVRGVRVAHWLILGVCLLNLLFLAGTLVWGDPLPLFGVSTIYRVVLGLGVMAGVLTIGALIYTVLAWRNSDWGVTTRVYYTLGTVASVAFVWFLNYWNLLGWRF